MGNERSYLEQVLGVELSKRVAFNYPLYRDDLRLLVVLPILVCAGRRLAVSESVEATSYSGIGVLTANERRRPT